MSAIDPFIQKVIWTLLGCAVATVAQLWLRGGPAEEILMMAAGGAIGAAWKSSPGDVPIKMIAEVARASIAPGSMPPVVKP